ncbi:uncharacterized protein LOC125772376 [Anopheles funestus]|uniref:uncharacterized protein LOC125772376 n=1 Tax=Anopheles funestus TaxID=62324 RepID=UPI0020C5D544|nr:uncharacterized protein LOC125772376 [Anopheles funestus]
MRWQDVVIVRVILFSAFVSQCWSVAINTKDDYELMPPLFEYENVTNCFEQYPTSVYCVVKTVLTPKEDSKVWYAIEKYSKNPSYHEHSLLDRGLCVDACVNLVNSLNSSTIPTFDTTRITVEPYVGVCLYA